MPVRVVMGDDVPAERRPRIVEYLQSSLRERPDSEELVAVVTRLPSGRLTVFVNHVSDSAFIATIEDAIARIR